MGLSTQKTTTNQTTTPQAPPWLTQPIQGFTGKINDFMGMDPTQFVAPTSPLQQSAFSQAGNLGGWQGSVNDAIGMAKAAGGTATPAAQSVGYKAPTVGSVTLGDAHTASPESLLTNLQAYMDPYTGQVVDTTLANYDAQTGRQAAAMAGQAAKAGAFGGSRYGIAEGEFGASSARDRAATEAGLRSDAFRVGAGLSATDAAARQQANMFNAGAWNTRDLTQGGFDMQKMLTQAGLTADASRFGAGARNTVNMFNASQQAADANRALEAAGLVGNLGIASGAGQRADIGMTADLGTLQRSIEEAKLNAFPTQLQLGSSLLGNLPYQAFVGSNMTGTTKTNVPWGPALMQGLGSAAQAAAMGGMKF